MGSTTAPDEGPPGCAGTPDSSSMPFAPERKWAPREWLPATPQRTRERSAVVPPQGADARCAGRRAALCGPRVSILRPWGQPTGIAQSTRRGAAFMVSPRTAVGAAFVGRRKFAKVEVPERTRGASINAPDAAAGDHPGSTTVDRSPGVRSAPAAHRVGIGAVPIRKPFAATWRWAPSVRNPLPPGTPANTGSRRRGSDPNGERPSGNPSHAATATVWPSSSASRSQRT